MQCFPFGVNIIFLSCKFQAKFLFKFHHHHHVLPSVRISLTLSYHFSLSFIASGRSSGLHPVSSHSCCMYVRAGRPVFTRPYVGVNRSTSLMSSSLLLQQCPACLVRLAWIIFVMGGTWPYSWCLVGGCCQVGHIFLLFSGRFSYDFGLPKSWGHESRWQPPPPPQKITLLQFGSNVHSDR